MTNEDKKVSIAEVVEQRDILAQTLTTLLAYLLNLDWRDRYSVDELIILTQKYFSQERERKDR